MKFNYLNFKPFEFPETLEELSEKIHSEIKNQLLTYKKNQDLISFTLSEKLDLLENVLLNVYKLDDAHQFAKIPADTRFPYNFGSLGDHCILVAAIMDLIVDTILALMDEKKTKDSQNLHSSDIYKTLIQDFFNKGVEISQKINKINLNAKLLRKISRITGLLHDVSKPDHKTHVTKGMEKTKEYFDILEIDPLITNEVMYAISKHHGFSTFNRFLPQILIIADYISTSERTGFISSDLFPILIDKQLSSNHGKFKSIFNSEEILKKFSEIFKKRNSEELIGLSTDFQRFGVNNSYPIYNTSSEEIQNTKFNKLLKELSDRISAKLEIDLDLASKAQLTFFYVEFGGIQSFIFASSKLKRIKSGSRFVAEINQLFKDCYSEILSSESIISSGGGNLIGICPMNRVKEIKNKVINEIIEEYADASEDILRRIRFHEKDFQFTFSEIHYGLKRTYYDFDEIKKFVQSSKSEEIKSYFGLNPIQNLDDNKKNLGNSFDTFELLEKFIQKKVFGELVSYFFNLPDIENVDDILNKYPAKFPFNNAIKCDYCENFASNKVDKKGSNGNNEESWLCPICYRIIENRNQSSQKKGDIEDKVTEFRETLIEKLNSSEEMNKILLANKKFKDVKFCAPLTIDDINPPHNNRSMGFKMSLDLSKIAIIKMDGNNIGVLKSKLPTPAAYHELSRMLNNKIPEMLLDSAFNVIEKFYRSVKIGIKDFINNENSISVPLEPVIIGGDDICILIRADLSMDFIQEFFKQVEEFFGTPYLIQNTKNAKIIKKIDLSFGKTFNSKLNLKDVDIKNPNIKGTYDPMGFSAGVFICDSQTPINRASNIAQILEDKSKEYIKKRILNFEMQNFRCIGAWNSVSFYLNANNDLTKSSLSQYYGETHDKNSNFRYIFSQFPMSTEEFSYFLKDLRDIKEIIKEKEISPNKLKEIIRTIGSRGPNANKLEFYYMIGRERNDDKIRLYHEILEKLFIITQENGIKTLYVPMADILKYYDFCGGLE